MANIHPTAIVHPDARIAEGAEVGPYCVIDGPARIGTGTRLIAHVYIHGNVTIGKENVLYPTVVLGFEPQSRKWLGEQACAGIVIGDRNILREGVNIHHATGTDHPTTVGNDNFFMANSHAGHDAVIHNYCTLTNGALIAGHATVQDHVIMGGNSAVHQFSILGRLSIIGGLVAVRHSVPPFGMCSAYRQLTGLNLVGMRRAGYTSDAVDAVRWGYDVLFNQGHTNPVAVQHLREKAAERGSGHELLTELADFVEQVKEGIVSPRPFAPELKVQH